MPPWVSIVNHTVTVDNVDTGPGRHVGTSTYGTVKRVEFDFRRSCVSVFQTNSSENPVKEYDLEKMRGCKIEIGLDGTFDFTFSHYAIPAIPQNTWRLDETSGNVAVDSSDHAHGAISGGVTLNQPGATIDGDTAMVFDGATGKILVNAPIPAIRASVSVWIKTTATGIRPIFSARRAGEPTDSHVYFGINDGKVYTYTTTGSTGIKSVNDGLWHHLVFSFTGLACAVFIDGRFDSTINVTGRGSISNKGSIGWDELANQFWLGSIDDLKIYPVALSPIQALSEYLRDTGVV